MDLKKIVEDLIECFLTAGDLAIELREKGLIKKIKSNIKLITQFILISN